LQEKTQAEKEKAKKRRDIWIHFEKARDEALANLKKEELEVDMARTSALHHFSSAPFLV